MERKIFVLNGDTHDTMVYARNMQEDDPAYKIVDEQLMTSMMDPDAWDIKYTAALESIFMATIDLLLVNKYDVIVTSHHPRLAKCIEDVAEINEAIIETITV